MHAGGARSADVGVVLVALVLVCAEPWWRKRVDGGTNDDGARALAQMATGTPTTIHQPPPQPPNTNPAHQCLVRGGGGDRWCVRVSRYLSLARRRRVKWETHTYVRATHGLVPARKPGPRSGQSLTCLRRLRQGYGHRRKPSSRKGVGPQCT